MTRGIFLCLCLIPQVILHRAAGHWAPVHTCGGSHFPGPRASSRHASNGANSNSFNGISSVMTDPDHSNGEHIYFFSKRIFMKPIFSWKHSICSKEMCSHVVLLPNTFSLKYSEIAKSVFPTKFEHQYFVWGGFISPVLN